ncbi:unnamed protein product [Cyberlindnera jadinii]|uniref:Nucleoside transporter n=1 Tax=Cyberlindnera jadinii (strain ATCC 18201 / CBS 1600 / BCRC 20928 / JCM 3617 / NBRC 0987 / NRRL Y-1542) TaxID=983966 RepID=A0A0H5BY96_CYBJN|nr:unnamed protein product [Cyberlindnera jadinii]
MSLKNDDHIEGGVYQSLQSRRGMPDEDTMEPAVFGEDRLLVDLGWCTLTLSQLGYISFMGIGIALLWPWNCFLSASGYFIGKFGADSALGRNYSSTMMTVSTLTSLASNSILSTRQFANFERRVMNGLILNVSAFLILAFVELIDPTLHSPFYFTGIMLLVLISAVGTSFQQNGCMALANVKGPEYAQAVMVGQAIAGVLPSLSLLLSELVYLRDNERSSTSIVLYFVMTSIITTVAGVVFHVTHKMEEPMAFAPDEENIDSSPTHGYVPFKTLFSKLQYVVLTIVFVFMVSLVFPIFASNTTSVHKGKIFDDAIFVPLAFFIWNCGDFTGRVLCGYVPFVISNDVKIFAYSILRVVLVPLLLMCNIDSSDTPIIASDTIYLLLQFFFGVTNGHCLSCAFMAVPLYCDENEREAAGGFTAVFLSLGLLLGSVFSFLFVPLVG